MTDIKVIFIIGKGRSGSTLLDSALGSLDGFFSMGEAWVWRGKDPTGAGICGCGEAVQDCPVWSRVRARMASMPGGIPAAAEIARWRADVERWSRAHVLLARGAGAAAKWPSLASYVLYASSFYRAVAEVTGANVLVDSSKWPANPGPLGLIPGLQPYVLHLVRDPRAVAFSWQRRKQWSANGDEMRRHGSAFSALSWLGRNFLADRVVRASPGKSMQLRYEDFVAQPAERIRTLAEWVGEHPENLPRREEHTLEIRTGHSLMGNAVRFRSGSVDVRPDDEWKAALRPESFLTTTLLTAPLLRRFGYPFLRRG